MHEALVDGLLKFIPLEELSAETDRLSCEFRH